MTIAEDIQTPRRRANGHMPSWLKGEQMPSWLRGEAFENFARSPSMAIPRPGRGPLKIATDRVRAKPAVTPTIAGSIGVMAVGLGIAGLLFPKSVARSVGIKAGPASVMTLFGLREFVTGYMLASDPTRSNVLWTRLGFDLFDLAVLRAADNGRNPHRGQARAALNGVLLVTVLDLVSAFRLSTVERNCR